MSAAQHCPRPVPDKAWRLLAMVLLVLVPAVPALAEPALKALTVTTAPGGGQTYSLSLQVLLLMSALTFLPAALIMMTSFTRIVIVLAILRQALGTAQTPTNQILVGLALFLTFFVMSPVFDQINESALQPYMQDKLPVQEAVTRAAQPLKSFMLEQTRESDLALFARLSGRENIEEPEQTPFQLVVPAFITSELKTAFQIGFLLFIPFLIIDLVVASVLMSMGMMMLSPMIISLPFKIMLFVLVDGWALVIGTLAASFHT
jgi:flagellar biosynthetic protein FliP